ncbi:MAG: pyrroline-5-carboxylate reductase [Eubacteriales bacterium]|nr:pyrroline-5-carboxylate reductase [Eubacteriales bacterium]
MKIGFLGIGNMGSAILKGILKNGIDANEIYAYDVDKERLNKIKSELNINICFTYESLINSIDCIILAIKPNIFKNVLKEIAPILKANNTLIVSIAAGLEINSIKEMLNNKFAPIIRIMPNINAEICMATSAYCYSEEVGEEELDEVVSYFEKIGSIYYIEEEKFSIFTAIAGCSPAYVYLFIDSLAKGAQKMGLPKKLALEIATNAVIGSANMINKSSKHPWELIDNVCSPGGTTIEGICTLEENNFQQTIVKAVENSIIKDNKLNNNK